MRYYWKKTTLNHGKPIDWQPKNWFEVIEILVILSLCDTGYNDEKMSELTQNCDERKQKCLASAKVGHDSGYNLSETVCGCDFQVFARWALTLNHQSYGDNVFTIIFECTMDKWTGLALKQSVWISKPVGNFQFQKASFTYIRLVWIKNCLIITKFGWQVCTIVTCSLVSTWHNYSNKQVK